MKRRTTKTPPRRSTHRPVVVALADLTHALADLVEAIEAALVEWQRMAQKEGKRG
jgi:hypothetical protein